MFNTNKEETSIKKEKEREIIDQLEIEDKNVEIHTMQDDINSLSGIFPKQEKPAVVKQETISSEMPDISNNVAKNEKYFNPFLNNDQNKEKTLDFYQKSEAPRDTFPQNNTFPQSQNNPAQDIFPQNSASQSEPVQNQAEPSVVVKGKSNKILWIAIILVIIAGFSAGYYYYLGMTNKENQPAEQVAVKEEPVKEDPVVEPEIEQETKYSTNKANYLSINTADPSFDDLSKVFLQTGAEIKGLNITAPVEFIITDERNNPISFSIFAVLSKIKLSSELLKNLEDDFSLYMVNDAGIIKLNLAVKVKDQEKANTLIKAEEGKLITELSSLFFDSIISPAKVVFKDGSYDSTAIRYFNIKEDGSQSIDYSFLKGKLLIGTSKNSMWAIVDKENLAK